MPRLVSPGGTVAHVGDGPLVRTLTAAGWRIDEPQPEPAPEKQAPRKRTARKTSND